MYTIPIIEKLGGREAVANALIRQTDQGPRPVDKRALNMWIMRGSIPGYAIKQLVQLAKRRRVRIEDGDFERHGTSRKSKKKEVKA